LLILSFTSFSQNAWDLNGNALNGLNNPFLGSTDNFDVDFKTNDLFRLRLTKSGRLGLNTLDPKAMFEVEYCLPPNPNSGGFLVTKDLCPAGFTFVPFDPNTTLEVIGFPFDGIIPVETNPNQQIKFSFSYLTGHTTNPGQPLMSNEGPLIWARTKGTNGWLLGGTTDINTKFIVMPDGSTGINIAQPRAALDVRGAQQYNHPSAIIGSLAPGTYNIAGSGLPQYYTQQVQFVPNLTNDGFNRISQLNDQGMFFSDGKGTEGSNLGGAFILAPWAQEADAANVGGMRMDALGNTEFHGTVRATKVNVDAKWWSDFVFEDNHSLPTLAEVEAFIVDNKHLPNVPSEGEVLENGIDVAEMQAIHMQKIEELTLYTIAQEKQLAAQQKRLEELEALVGELLKQ
jgi:hypothetical protein